jgi:hypothetical protein
MTITGNITAIVLDAVIGAMAGLVLPASKTSRLGPVSGIRETR